MLCRRLLLRALNESPRLQIKIRFCSSFFEKRFKTLATEDTIAKIYERRRTFDLSSKERTEKSLDPKKYRLVCPICEKPNITTSHECGACNFDLHPLDVVEMRENIFSNIAEGHVTEHRIYCRNEDLVVLGDKFPIADVHLDCIPTTPIEDITNLNTNHINLLRNMYEEGRQVIWQQIQSSHLLSSKIDRMEQIDPLIIAGFNLPVSVYHLHLHMIVPPLRHTNSFKFPRWHPYPRVMRDLTKYGRVITNKELRGRDADHIQQLDPDHEAEILKNERAIELIAGIASRAR